MIAFLTEANTEIGYGHLYRSIALAETFKEKGEEVLFVTDSVSEMIIYSFFTNSVEVISLNSISDKRIEVLFVDVFSKNIDNYKFIFEIDIPTTCLIIDEVFYDNLNKYSFDLVFKIGFQAYHKKLDYESINYKPCIVYSGNDFFIFRKEFNNLKNIDIKDRGYNLLISMGGSDPKSLTEMVLESLSFIDIPLKVDVVLGSNIASGRMNKITEIKNRSIHDIEILQGISNMASLMAKQDVAVINGGNTRFELALSGIPFISMSINEVQNTLAENLTEHGIGLNLGVYNKLELSQLAENISRLLTDKVSRKKMSEGMKRQIVRGGNNLIFEKIKEFQGTEFRKLNDEEVKIAHKIHSDLVESMLSRGIKQWLSPIAIEKLEDRQKKGENYGLFQEGNLKVFLSLTQRFDYHEWSDLMKSQGTFWLNTVSVNINNKQKGLGRYAILLAIQYLKEKNIKELYLDCVVNEGFLVDYYKSIGFSEIGRTTATYRSGTFNLSLMKIDIL